LIENPVSRHAATARERSSASGTIGCLAVDHDAMVLLDRAGTLNPVDTRLD
jgi:hypothetical protein